MPERSALTQGVQIGVETTPGTSVAANKKFQSIGIGPAGQVDIQKFRPMGSKWPTIEVPGKEWVEADIEGVGSYTELLYFFNSCLVAANPVQEGATTAYTTTFTPAQSTEDTLKTYTVEQGGSVRAHKFTYGIVTELELDMNREGVEVTGSMLGQQLQDNIALTGSPTAIQQKPILPMDIDLFLDTTSGGLGTTKQLRVLNVNWALGDRVGPVWVLNSANNSWVAHVETEPTMQITVLMEADAQGMAILTDMRAGTTKFMRVVATSDDLAGTAFPYKLQIDAAVKVNDMGEFSDEDGVYAIEWTYDVVYDATWNKSQEVKLTSQITAL